MAELVSGSVVSVVNPSAVVQVSAPGLVQGLWLKEGPAGPAGRNVTSIARTAGTGAPGTTDTYTITYSDNTTATFQIYNGANGTGDVTGPAAATNNNLAAFNLATGKVIKDSGVATSLVSGAAQKSNNLSDLANATTARTNLGLGTAATKNTGTGASQIPVLSASPGTPDGTKFLRDDGTWAVGGSGSTLLAIVTRTSATATSYSTTSTTPADIDATNLAVTFTAPASGQVDVILSANALVATSGMQHWSLRNGTTNIAGTERGMTAPITTAFAPRFTYRSVVTGLTSGTSYTFKWAWRTSGGTASLSYGGAEFSGTNYGPATMEVWSA